MRAFISFFAVALQMSAANLLKIILVIFVSALLF